MLASSGSLKDSPAVIPKPKLDSVGVVLSAAGLGLFVMGVLQTTGRGWSDPLVLTMLFGGLAFLAAFVWWIRRQDSLGKPVLVHPSIFRHRTIGAGLPVLATQTFAQAGLLFLIPLFTQSVLGFDAFETGLALLPLSIGVLATSMTTPRLGRIIYPRYIVQGGLVLLFVGGYILARALPDASEGSDLALGLLIGGLAIGLVAGQLPNMILSGVDPTRPAKPPGFREQFSSEVWSHCSERSWPSASPARSSSPTMMTDRTGSSPTRFGTRHFRECSSKWTTSAPADFVCRQFSAT